MQIAVGNSIINCKVSGAPVEGARPAVVFLHGWGRTMSDFDGLEKRLLSVLPGAAFIGLDLPGFGGSPLPSEGGFSLDDYCRATGELFNKLGIKNAILIGHSFGGRVAIKFAARFPERTDKLILIAAAGIRKRTLYRRLLSLGRKIFRKAFRPLAGSRLERFLGARFASSDYRLTSGALRETFKKIVSEDLRPEAAKIKIPALLLWGRNDAVTPLEEGEVYHSLMANSRIEVLDCGHFPLAEKPEESAEIISSFLLEHTRNESAHK